MDMPLTSKVEDEPTTPPNSPHGQLQVNDTGDMSLTFRFPAEVTSWSHVSADEPGILVCLDTLPFSHFSISALTLTYHDARNRRDASRELREPTRSQARSMLDFR